MFHTQAWNDIVSAEQSEKMQKVLDTSVDQIAGVCCNIQIPFNSIKLSTLEHIIIFQIISINLSFKVRKSLEGLASLVRDDSKKDEET